MTISRKYLYAFGEPFGDCATAKKVQGGVVCGGGSESSTSTTSQSTSTPTTNNVDKRNAVQDGIGISGDGNSVSYEVNSSDAVVAIANAGSQMIRDAGGAVVELNKAQITANVQTWDKTLTTGAKLVDKLIDKVGDGFALSEKVVSSFEPTDNKNSDAIKYAAIAAGVLGVSMIWGKK